MDKTKPSAAPGTDWTQLLADPDLAKNLGKLLQTYRDAPPERREEALLAAMREIKQASSSTSGVTPAVTISSEPPPQPVPTSAASSPPFEPDIFSPNWAQDRRRHLRIKCFVAVELRVEGAAGPAGLGTSALGRRGFAGTRGGGFDSGTGAGSGVGAGSG